VTTDIYQVGLTLFRLINGIGLIREHRDRMGVTEFERLKTLGRVPAQKDCMPFAGREIRRIISRATNPDPSQRFQSALEMRRALERMNHHGYWDTEPSGGLFGALGQYNFTFGTGKSKRGLAMAAYRENIRSGRTTKVLKFCCSGLSPVALEKLQRSYLCAVVEGEI